MAAPALTRAYRGSDANLMQQANLNNALLTQNLTAFTAEDPTMDADFLSDYGTDIATAEHSDTDHLVKATLQQKSEVVEEAMEAAWALMRQVRYYVLEAFPPTVRCTMPSASRNGRRFGATS